MASLRGISLSARYVPGQENNWAYALSRFWGTLVEWQLRPRVSSTLAECYGLPQVDLFTSLTTAQLPLHLTLSQRTEARGPDSFMEGWNNWIYIYSFPPPATAALLKVDLTLVDHKIRVLLISPFWQAQLWFGELTRWCPAPPLLELACLSSDLAAPLQTSLNLHT